MKEAEGTRTYTLPSQWLAYAGEGAEGEHYHPGQVALQRLGSQPERVLLLHSPTGAGKTHGFVLSSAASEPMPLAGRCKTLILSPTNALLVQTAEELQELAPAGEKVVKVKASELGAKGGARAKEMFKRMEEATYIVTTPDLFNLLLTSFYYRGARRRNYQKEFSQLFRTLRFFIFDEYHLFDEEALARCVGALLLAEKIGRTDPRFVFASATPPEWFERVLTAYGVSYTVARDEPISLPLAEGEGRKVKGELTVSFHREPLRTEVERLAFEPIYGEGRRLFLFDTLKDADESYGWAKEAGIPDCCPFMGWETGTDRERYGEALAGCRNLFATNKAEQGVNLDATDLHMEPGFSWVHFWQRFGRAGREGAQARISVYGAHQIFEHLPPENMIEPAQLLEAIVEALGEKDRYIRRVHHHLGAFMACVRAHAGKVALWEQVAGAVMGTPAERIFKLFGKVALEISRFEKLSQETALDPSYAQDIRKWWESYLDNFYWFRGPIDTVPVVLETRDPPLRTEHDWSYVLAKTEYRIQEEEDEKGNPVDIYHIEGYLDQKRELHLEFEVLGQPVVLKYWEAHKRGFLREKVNRQIVRFFEVFEGLDEVEEQARLLRDLLAGPDGLHVTLTLHPGLLKPKDVRHAITFI